MIKRFWGSLAAVLVVLVVGGVWYATRPVSDHGENHTPSLFAFEKEDLVGIRIVRPDTTIEMVQKDGEWLVVGQPWKPSRSMVRRVAHQIHDLTARAVVAEDVADPSLYGVGDTAIHVALTLKDGRTIEFAAGDPNPSSVSYYVRPIPGDAVFVVKKSAMDYYRLSLDEFREHRFAWMDADDADRIESDLDGRHLTFVRVDEGVEKDKKEERTARWKMTAPIAQDASREEVRTMLGRTGALKAAAFVEDQPKDLAKYGFENPYARIMITQTADEPITLRVGSALPGTDPPERYVYREEDDAVYTARDGFLEAFSLPVEQYRNRQILGKHEWDVQSLIARMQGQQIALDRSGDDWRWPDGSPVPGSTPSRVAGRAAEVEAEAFHDPGMPSAIAPAKAGLDPAFATIELHFADGVRTVSVGGSLTVPREPMPIPPPPPGDNQPRPPPPTEEERRYVQVDGDPTIYEVDGSVGSVIEDLFREYGRKKERDQEKKVRDDAQER